MWYRSYESSSPCKVLTYLFYADSIPNTDNTYLGIPIFLMKMGKKQSKKGDFCWSNFWSNFLFTLSKEWLTKFVLSVFFVWCLCKI